MQKSKDQNTSQEVVREESKQQTSKDLNNHRSNHISIIKPALTARAPGTGCRPTGVQ